MLHKRKKTNRSWDVAYKQAWGVKHLNNANAIPVRSGRFSTMERRSDAFPLEMTQVHPHFFWRHMWHELLHPEKLKPSHKRVNTATVNDNICPDMHRLTFCFMQLLGVGELCPQTPYTCPWTLFGNFVSHIPDSPLTKILGSAHTHSTGGKSMDARGRGHAP